MEKAFAFLLTLFAAAPCLAADAPSAVERKKISSCIERQTNADKSIAPCIGLVADPCIKAKPDTEPAKECARRELAIWSERLKALTTSGPQLSFAESKKAIIESEAPWLAGREKLCAVFDAVDPGMALGGADYCRMIETGRRVATLEKLKAATSEH